MADTGVPIFRGGSGSDCEEFIRAVYAYAFEKDKTDESKWIAAYAATRLSGKALRWYARQDNTVKVDWSALQVALLDQYPPSDDDEEEADEFKAQPWLNNVPTPAAAAGPSAGVITIAASAPTPSSAKKATIADCKKARIRVEGKDGTAIGWISVHMGPFTSQLTTLPGDALQVKAKKVNSGPTTLWILNITNWSRLCIGWSTSPFDGKDGRQSGQLKPCDKSGRAIKTNVFEVTSLGQCSPDVWDIDDAGVITPTWRETGGSNGVPLRATGSNRFVFYSTQITSLFQPSHGNNVKFVYEPIE